MCSFTFSSVFRAQSLRDGWKWLAVLNGLMSGRTSSGLLWSSVSWFKDVPMLVGLEIKSYEKWSKESDIFS